MITNSVVHIININFTVWYLRTYVNFTISFLKRDNFISNDVGFRVGGGGGGFSSRGSGPFFD